MLTLDIFRFPSIFSMADILPFRGLIYNLKKVEDLSLVTAPPYDVISEKSMPKVLCKHPYNVIRLELGDDASGQDRYHLCTKYFNDWEREGILIREEEPAFYFYQVGFPLNGENGKFVKGSSVSAGWRNSGEGDPPP